MTEIDDLTAEEIAQRCERNIASLLEKDAASVLPLLHGLEDIGIGIVSRIVTAVAQHVAQWAEQKMPGARVVYNTRRQVCCLLPQGWPLYYRDEQAGYEFVLCDFTSRRGKFGLWDDTDDEGGTLLVLKAGISCNWSGSTKSQEKIFRGIPEKNGFVREDEEEIVSVKVDEEDGEVTISATFTSSMELLRRIPEHKKLFAALDRMLDIIGQNHGFYDSFMKRVAQRSETEATLPRRS